MKSSVVFEGFGNRQSLQMLFHLSRVPAAAPKYVVQTPKAKKQKKNKKKHPYRASCGIVVLQNAQGLGY